jgi:hypothetical protein
MYPGYRLKVLHSITFSVLLYLHLKPTAGYQMSTSSKQIWAGGGPLLISHGKFQTASACPLGVNLKGIAKAV